MQTYENSPIRFKTDDEAIEAYCLAAGFMAGVSATRSYLHHDLSPLDLYAVRRFNPEPVRTFSRHDAQLFVQRRELDFDCFCIVWDVETMPDGSYSVYDLACALVEESKHLAAA